MNDTAHTPTTAEKIDAVIPTITVTPEQKKENDKTFKAVAKDGAEKLKIQKHKKPATTEITPQQKAEDLSKVIDAFLIGNKTAEKLKPEQITLCKQTALAFGLNPLKREIHFIPREIKRKNPQSGYWEKTGEYEVSIVIGYEVYIKRAEATQKLDGWGVRFEKDGTDTKAIITIHKKGWQNPFEHEVYLSEARQQSPIWDKMPKFMLRKVTIGQGFRLAFPEEMGGLPYLPEEIGAGVIENGEIVEDRRIEAPKPAYTKPNPPPAPITLQQCTMILGLLARKGKEQQPILDFFRVDKLSKLTYTQGEGVMRKLNGYPDAADKIAVKDEAETLNLDEIDKGIEQQRLDQEVTQAEEVRKEQA